MNRASSRQRIPQRAILILLVALASYLGSLILRSEEKTYGDSAIAEAYEKRLEDVIVETGGRVVRVLPEDTKPPRHQRILILVAPEHTVLITHNVDVAERVPAIVGESLLVRGEYVWNDRGGLIHWTHRTERGDHPPGWIVHRGKRYD